jgi:plasmid stabilization system protein ParE
MAQVIVTGPAAQDIEAAYSWWKQNRSAEQAARWYIGIRNAVHSLRTSPERYPFAQERDLLPQGVRQLLFGIGRRATHRIVYTIDAGTVIVLRIRHASQDTLTNEDLDH